MSFFGAIGDLIGTGINAGIQNKVNKENADLQREFAQNSLQWKIADAKKAGIHPLAAINAPTYSASPSFVGANVGDGISRAFSQAGDSLSKAEAQKEAKEAQKKQDILFDLEVEQRRLENAKLASEIAKNHSASLSGLSPFSDNTSRSVAKDFAQSISTPPKDKRNASFGYSDNPLDDVTFDKNPDGSISINYGEKRQDLYSEGFLEKLAWSARNTFSPDKKRIERDKRDIATMANLSKDFKVVALPYRPGSGRRFKIVPKDDKYDYGSIINQIKALLYLNRE